jgi:hypothetical protein
MKYKFYFKITFQFILEKLDVTKPLLNINITYLKVFFDKLRDKNRLF